jgi:hypothetical protein
LSVVFQVHIAAHSAAKLREARLIVCLAWSRELVSLAVEPIDI